jgi:lipopolysaccharide transport system ATP-binding protein
MCAGNIAIEVDQVCKVFRIGAKEGIHDSLGSAFVDFIRSPLKNYRKYRSLYKFDDVELVGDSSSDGSSENIIWAVKDVSFTLKEGEVLGIVGKNGAGKSTLLKILARITPPTQGRAVIRGRISSLLEVGTGFHQELTGRENVYLNGTILGMRKKEVDQKFEEIVEFSGVEKFLDTPVKRYSSGMRVRLAFAVAAHLEPEVLIVDEVLAVGDTAFQRKCLDKMQDVGREGRTVLFVSHNLPAISMLCGRAILLEEGKIEQDGAPHDVISSYLNSGTGSPAHRQWSDADSAPGRDIARLRSVRIVSRDGHTVHSVDIRQEIGIEMVFDVIKGGHVLLPQYAIFNEEGIRIFGTFDQDPEWLGRGRPEGRYTSTAWIPGNLLTDGMFFVTCNLINRDSSTYQFSERQVIAFNIMDNMGDDTARGDWAGRYFGIIRPKLEWSTKYDSDVVGKVV